jgi:HK97 gp10 family phage protein
MRFELSVRNSAATVANLYAADKVLKRELKAGVRDFAEYARGLVALYTPVDTGFMQAHVRKFVSKGGLVWEVGWDASDFFGAGLAFYPFFVEFGTVHMAPRYPMTTAYREIAPQFATFVSHRLREAVERKVRAQIREQFFL